METTLTTVLDTLRKRGYTEDFNTELVRSRLNNYREIKPGEFFIDKVYRFDGMTDPEDETIVYAISSMDGKRKGILVNGYGIYSDARVNSLLEKIEHKESIVH